MITATELLDFLTKAQRVSSAEITFIQLDGGYYITLYGDWHDDGEFFNYIQSDYIKYEEDMYYE